MDERERRLQALDDDTSRMQPTFFVFVNRSVEGRVIRPEEVDPLCRHLAELPVFTVHVTGERGEAGPTLDAIVVSDQALVDYLDLDRGIKRTSRNETCTQRGVLPLTSDVYPELELNQIEVQWRDLISRERALSILRHYLTTGEAIDLVHWPPDDWDEWGDDEVAPTPPDEDIPF